jgi:cytochrome c553
MSSRHALTIVALVVAAGGGAGLGCAGNGEHDDDDEGEGGVLPVSASECASRLLWVGGDEESSRMHPGTDCVACHEREGEGPRYDVAGTVYAEAHEADDCFGVEGVLVELTGGDGAVHRATTNQAGNFFMRVDLATPFTARIEYEGREARMTLAQSSGRCATCHTTTGASGAPGRIVAP